MFVTLTPWSVPSLSDSFQRLDWRAVADTITQNEFCRHAPKQKLACYQLQRFWSLTLAVLVQFAESHCTEGPLKKRC